MKDITLTLLAAAAIGAVSVGSASAMPLNSLPAAQGENHVQNVRVVCNQNGRCYNTRHRAYRSVRHYYGPRAYYGGPGYGYYAGPGYGYYRGPRAGVGIGPFGFGVW